eukprot:4097566-Amphidinium_carterae.2
MQCASGRSESAARVKVAIQKRVKATGTQWRFGHVATAWQALSPVLSWHFLVEWSARVALDDLLELRA